MNTIIATNRDPEVSAAMADHFRQASRLRECIQADRLNGEDALRRLLPIAQGHSGQSRRVALALLDGTRLGLLEIKPRIQAPLWIGIDRANGTSWITVEGFPMADNEVTFWSPMPRGPQ